MGGSDSISIEGGTASVNVKNSQRSMDIIRFG
jgi:hypothetical protein